MRKLGTLLGGIGVGALAMYLFDPDTGRRRRALARDQAIRAWHKGCDAADATGRDLRNRALGFGASVRSRFTPHDDSPLVVERRVRAKLGRYVSHPHSIQVTADPDGRITLSGPILKHEMDGLLSAVGSIPGVTAIDSRLEAHEAAGNVPGLQGGIERPGERFELFQENWSPAARLLVGLGGGWLLWNGIRRRDPMSLAFSALGAALITRGATNVDTRRLVGLGGGRQAVDVHKTIQLAAPVERVYEFWSSYENFPRFMSHVREVREIGTGRSHWVVDGPAGVPVEWDAEITQRVPNQMLAWRSVEGSPVAHAGIVRFEPDAGDGTRADIRMTYSPPGGGLGHAVASFFGAHPKRQMDDDLARLKTLIETGRQPRDATAPEPVRSHA